MMNKSMSNCTGKTNEFTH